jgi:hypothetical protein
MPKETEANENVPTVYVDEDLARRLIKRARELGYTVGVKEDGTLKLTGGPPLNLPPLKVPS